MNTKRLILLVFLTPVLYSACWRDSYRYSNGYYTAEAVSFDSRGWKEFVSIYINNNKLVSAEFNAKNTSGFIKSWDVEYMDRMNRVTGCYPTKYNRYYTAALIDRQDIAKIDALSGATESFMTFKVLSAAALGKAREGDKTVAFVELYSQEEAHGEN